MTSPIRRLPSLVLSLLLVGAALGGLSIAAAQAAEPSAQKEDIAMLNEGDQAPDFSLPASDGQTYSLAQFIGVRPVVIAFFPKAFTGG